MTGLFLTDYSVYGFLPQSLPLTAGVLTPTTYSLIYGFALFMAFLAITSTAMSPTSREENG